MAKAKKKPAMVEEPKAEVKVEATPKAEKKPTKKAPAKSGAKVGNQEAAEKHIEGYLIPKAYDTVFVTGNGFVFYGSQESAATKYASDKKVDLYTVKL